MRNIFEKDPTERDEERLLALLEQESLQEDSDIKPTAFVQKPMITTLKREEIRDFSVPVDDEYGETLEFDPSVLDGISSKDYESIYGGDDYGETLPMDARIAKLLRRKRKAEERGDFINSHRLGCKLLICFIVAAGIVTVKNIDNINDSANEPKDDDSFFEINIGKGAPEDVVNAIVKKYDVEKNEIEISNGIAKVPKPKQGRRIY